MYERFGSRAEFVLVYIREAHSTDGWKVDASGWSIIADATSLNERRATAAQTCGIHQFQFPIVVDTMDDAVAVRWSAWPERLFVVSSEGNIVYVGQQGPWGFWPLADKPPYRFGEDHPNPPGQPLDTCLEKMLATHDVGRSP